MNSTFGELFSEAENSGEPANERTARAIQRERRVVIIDRDISVYKIRYRFGASSAMLGPAYIILFYETRLGFGQ